jgi:hypothetical protein
MRVNAAQPAQPPTPGSQPPPIRQLDRPRIATHHVGHRAAALQQHSDLAADFEADLREFSGQFVTDHALDRHAAPGETLQSADLTGFETAGVADDLDGSPLPGVRSPRAI